MSYEFLPLSETRYELNEALREIADAIRQNTEAVDELARDSLRVFAYTAYGSMSLATTTGLGPPDITAAYQDVTFYDTLPIVDRGMTFDINTGTFEFLLQGVYAISVIYAIEHADIGAAGQTMTFRLRNITQGVSTLGVVVGTARNAIATFMSGTLLVDITSGNFGDVYVMEVGAATKDYTAVQWDTCTLSLWNVGEFRGIL